jgi:hypothetical protein
MTPKETLTKIREQAEGSNTGEFAEGVLAALELFNKMDEVPSEYLAGVEYVVRQLRRLKETIYPAEATKSTENPPTWKWL